MRSWIVVAAGVGLTWTACGGEPTPSARGVTPAPGNAESRAADPFASPALVAAVDLSSALDVGGPAWPLLEQALGLREGALPSPESLGVDTSRPVVLAVARPDEAVKRTIRDLLPLVPASDPHEVGRRGLVDALTRVVRRSGIQALARIIVPVSSGARTVELARRALTALGGRADAEDVFIVNGRVIRLARSGTTLQVDFDLIEALDQDVRDRVLALRSLPDGDVRPPFRDEHDLHVTYEPLAIGELGFLWGAVLTGRALANVERMNSSRRDGIGAQGLWEASRSLALAGSEKGPFFTRVTLDADLSRTPRGVVVRAEIGPGHAAAFAESLRGGTSIALAGANASGEVSMPLLAGWPLLGGEAWRREANALMVMANEAGHPGKLLAASHAPLFAATVLVRDRNFDATNLDPSRFERVGFALMGQDRMVAYGILPESANAMTAECALSPPGDGCKHRLQANATTKSGASFARLARVDERWVVLVGPRPGVDAKLTARRDAPPLSGAVDRALMARELPLVARLLDATTAVGEVRRDRGAVLVTIRSAPAK